jgi:DNA-binding transcriptional ArsR family regulator
MEEVLQAIASGYRRRILQVLRERELSAGEVASHFPYVTRPAISQHLSILKDVRLVQERRAGTRRLYRVRPEALSELRTFLEPFWEDAARNKVADIDEMRRGFAADDKAARAQKDKKKDLKKKKRVRPESDQARRLRPRGES